MKDNLVQTPSEQAETLSGHQKSKTAVAIDEWKEMYRAANGKEPPRVTHSAGWITIYGKYDKQKKRVGELLRMTENLRGLAEERAKIAASAKPR